MEKYENCVLNDILRGIRHARQLVTAGVRMLPCFPGVGDGADYRTFGPQTNGIVLGLSFSQEMIPHFLLVPQVKITLSRNLSINLFLLSYMKLL